MTRPEVRWLTDTFQQAQPFRGQATLATYQGGLSHLVLLRSVIPFQASFRASVIVSLCRLLPDRERNLDCACILIIFLSLSPVDVSKYVVALRYWS